MLYILLLCCTCPYANFVLYLALCYAVYFTFVLYLAICYFCVVSYSVLCCILLHLCCIWPYVMLNITSFVLYLAWFYAVYYYFCVVSCPMLCCILLLLCYILPYAMLFIITFALFLALCCVVYYYFCVVGIVHKIFWVPDKPPVNKRHCRCDCFDTVFKGSYWITLLCFPWIVSQEQVRYQPCIFNHTTLYHNLIWNITLSI